VLGALLAAAALAMAGCQPRHRIELSYRPGTGTVDPFAPSRIAVMPAGDTAVNQLVVGTVFDPDGNLERLFIVNPPEIVGRVVAGVLDHAGLKATVFTAGGEPPDGIDYVVSCSPEELSVVKRIDKENSPAENSFIMEAKARLSCSLADRSGTVLLSGDFSGSDNEPPLGAAQGGPLISDPAEALSAAVADAVDAFANHPDFRRALPERRTASFDIPANAPRATSSATPTPAGKMPSAAATPHPAASPARG
jgi:hypothetical protein